MTHMQSKHTSCYYIGVNGNGKTLKQLALLRLTAGNAKETELLNEHICTKTRFSLVVFCMLVLLIHDTQHEATCEIHFSVLCNIQFNNRESSSFLLLQDFLKQVLLLCSKSNYYICIFVQKRVKSYQN